MSSPASEPPRSQSRVHAGDQIEELAGRAKAPHYRRAIKFFGILLSLACAFYVFWFVRRQWTQLSGLEFSWETAGAFAGAVLLYLIAAFGVALGWRELVRALGGTLGPHLAFVLVWRTQIAKYLPSNLVHYGGRIFLARIHGVRLRVTSGTLIMEVCLTAIACLVLSTPLLFEKFWLGLTWAGGLLASCGVLGVIGVLYWRSLPAAERRRGGQELLRRLGMAALYYGAVVVVLAFALFLILSALDPAPVRWLSFPRVLTATAFAWIVGIAAVGAPAGLGVREAILLLTLQGHYPGVALATAVILHRLSTTAGDCAAFGLTFINPPAPPNPIPDPQSSESSVRSTPDASEAVSVQRMTYFGTYDADYSRNRTLIAGLRSCGVEVQECHEDLYGGTTGKLQAAKGDLGHLARLFFRACRIQRRLLGRFLRLPASDAVILGYSAQVDILSAWILTRLRGEILVADIMTPLWLICCERHPQGVPWLTRLIVRTLESLTIRLSDLALVETAEVAEFLAHEYGVEAARFVIIPVGAGRPEEVAPMESRLCLDLAQDKFVVLYHGKFIPQHGIETMLDAARVLRGNPEIVFVFVGQGQDSQTARDYAAREHLQNVLFTGHVPTEQLRAFLRRADVCLGVFGTSRQSRITAHNKIFEALAASKPLISGRSAPIERLFRDGEELLLVERGQGDALAAAIIHLLENPAERKRLAEGARHALDRGGYFAQPLAEKLVQTITRKRTDR